MKIKTIEFKDDSVLGNLFLDFTDKDGNIKDTIIIAGENGVGKSYILSVIYETIQISVGLIGTGKRIFRIKLSQDEIEKFKDIIDTKNYFIHDIKDNEIEIVYDFSIKNNWNKITIKGHKLDGIAWEVPSLTFHNANSTGGHILKSIFSDVEINFTPRNISTVTTKNIDDNVSNEKSTNNLATDITQLLVDVQSTDALEFTEWARNNKQKQIDESKIDTRIKRFTMAFHHMFPSKRYKRIENSKNQKKIIFEENGREMDITQLSSGEKQIVFRGSFLLKNRESTRGALILIDEPEISLHPNWQLKILDFFKKLFTNEEGIQTSQIILSTHSPFIIHNFNRSDDKVIILKKNESGFTKLLSEPTFLGWTHEKAVKEAFNISSILSDDKTKVFLEGETDEKYFNKALEVFSLTRDDLSINWIGRINENGSAENSGDTALNNAMIFFKSNIEFIHCNIILLYDNDTKKPVESFGTLYIDKMEYNVNNSIFKKGVENLLDISGIDITQFYKERKKVDDYSAESIIKELDKVKLCEHICSLDNEVLKKVLINIKNEIDKINMK